MKKLLQTKGISKFVSAEKRPMRFRLHVISFHDFDLKLIILHGKYRNCISKTEMCSDCYQLHLDVFLKHTLTSWIN